MIQVFEMSLGRPSQGDLMSSMWSDPKTSTGVLVNDTPISTYVFGRMQVAIYVGKPASSIESIKISSFTSIP